MGKAGFEGRGLPLTIDAGWRDVADVAFTWFERQTLAVPSASVS